ncbi:cytochrome P450 [Pseudonocardia humida]|uniref:Cytochrome P450 n=1 Tax=Pseudonocardia humida TaxID=2800819 RepID=A0ABT0ZTD8_9PSEU|nr:cytochrome P450 [Pseudonocardia humida]MCO1653996.1 cytochrome P450 [Pseudonocardia humida]
MTTTDATRTGPTTASAADTARVLGLVLAPVVAQGVIARRPRVVGAAARLGLDARGVRELQRLRERYGTGPVRLPIPGRPMALVLDPPDVRRVLEGTPVPFAADSWEKRGALRQLQPHGVLISPPGLRAERRRFNEAVLDTGHPMHRYADAIARVVREETAPLADRDVLDWDGFITAWWRIVRRVVLGDGARDDHALTDDLRRLRQAGNWSWLAPRRRRRYARVRDGLRRHVERADPGSLAELVAALPAGPDVDRLDQVPQWLFAYDPAGMATFRALALLAAHPAELDRARAEVTDPAAPQDLPRLRAAVLESVRLWPTTPLILRDAAEATDWDGATLPAGTGMVVPAWFLHRDDRTRADAHRFHPEQWLDGSAFDDPALVPFSAGPAVCPGRELVLFTAATFLAVLLRDRTARPPFPADRPLPANLSPFTLRIPLTR